ncbi:Ras-related RABC2a -like protein [Gossypium arboreum]|uniref:Ras-related RABC2a-like protein n=1 Tax=Gossypium arboreum TaxID=29729 RepID=A0A0B0PZQ1_GOSAR|nr:Ras-related RABC2a -like protein [Gossypium arboreum]
MLGSSSSSSKGGGNNNCDYSFKILLIGDSGVGKSSLLVTFISNFVHDLSPTIGVDFKIKMVTIGGKRLKLTIWDTVYDVTRRETFTNLSEVWAKEVELYSTNQECIKVLVGNKVDRDSERAVTQEEGMALAQQLKCSFLECSARTRANVHQCFKDLVLKILEVPTLLEKGSTAVKKQILQQKQVRKPPESNACCFQ